MVSAAAPGRLTASAALATLLAMGGTPALAGPPFRTDDPEPVGYQHWEVDLFSTSTQTNAGWNGLLPGLEVNYGAIPNLQLHAIVAEGFQSITGGPNGAGFANVELGAKYRFITPGEND